MGYPRDYLLNRALNADSSVSMSATNRGGGANAAAAAEAPKVKEIFDVKLKAVDAKAKIKIIKEIRTITGLGLKEVHFWERIYLCVGNSHCFCAVGQRAC